MSSSFGCSLLGRGKPQMRELARRAARRRGAWVVLVALIVCSVVARAWASRAVTTPWIAPDEMLYGLLGQSLYHSARLAILDRPAGFLSAVVPAVFGLPLSDGNLERGYSIAKAVGAVVMSLAAVPVYLWGRALVGSRSALIACALTLLLPGLAYTGLLMSEVVFYPVLVLAAWSLAVVLEAPTRRHQWLFVGAVLLALLTRLQAVVLIPAFVLAVVIEATLRRGRVSIRAYTPTVAAFCALAAAWVAIKVVQGGPLLGGYKGAEHGYPVGRAALYSLYHLGDLALLCGVLPACALGALVVRALRCGEPDPRSRAYLAATVAVVGVSIIEVAIFAAGNVQRIEERDLLGLAPLLFLSLMLWLRQSEVDGRRLRAAVGLVVVVSVLAIPVGRLMGSGSLGDAFSFIPLYHLRALTSVGVTTAVLAGGVVAATLVFVLLPRRLLPVLPVLVGLALAGGSVAASRQVVSESDQQRALAGAPVRRWIDDAGARDVAYLYLPTTDSNAVWQAIFWNRGISGVFDLQDTPVVGPLPQTRVSIAGNGVVRRADGTALRQPFAVVPQAFALVGEAVAYAPRNADQLGVALWRTSSPVRVSTITSGLEENGDIDPAAGYTTGDLLAYGCEHGSFELTLLVKEAETIKVLLNEREVVTRTFPGPTQWDVEVPADPSHAGPGGICHLQVVPTGLTGTTQFAFVR